jgi:hypothetical protein
METQNQIKRTLSGPEAIARVRRLIDDADDMVRTKLAEEVCEQFGFFDPCGGAQRSTCLKALRELEEEGHITLPVGRGGARKAPSPLRLPEAVPPARGVPSEAGDVRGLQLILVETVGQRRMWNEMLIREHPRGAGPLVGRQLRYLVSSQYGLLGALGFGAAALQLRNRDRWIGWDVDTRRANLHYVVCLNRFLIRPGVRCHNLASRVLGMAMRALPSDFEARFGYRPLLVESFVDGTRFLGTCYREANWVWAGRTQGRGRQDRYRKFSESVKDIYLYALDKDFRGKLGLAAQSGLTALDYTDGIDGQDWADKEFGGALLGDTRLSRRLVEVAGDKAQKPGRAFSGVAKGDWPKVKAYYRLIDAPEDSAVTVENILRPHRDMTVRRMMGQQTVLCIQDGTDLDYTGLSQCSGLGVIGANQTGAQSKGLHLHSMMALTTDGVPLGILRVKLTGPEPRSDGEARRAPEIPIEEKKTFCWIEGIRDCVELCSRMPKTSIVSVMDREADFFELFDEQRRNPCVDLLVRAHHDRRTAGEHKLFDTVRQAPVQGQLRIQVGRQSERPKKSKQKARPKRVARTAEVSLRYAKVHLLPPPYHKDKTPIAVWIVHIVEDNVPEDAEGIEWFLVTTIEIASAKEAEQCVRWYCLRWRIEDWHRVLKSGCRIEQIAHKTAERLKRAIAINVVIAWRIMLMTLLGRRSPELPAEVLFTDLEVEVLQAYAKKNA